MPHYFIRYTVRKAVRRPALYAQGAIGGNESTGRLLPPAARMAPGASEDFSEQGASSYGIPITVGLGVRFYLAPRLSVGTGLDYSILSRTFTGNFAGTSGSVSHTLQYLGVPLNLYYDIIDAEKIKFYAYGGGEIEYCISNKYRLFASPDIIRKYPVDKFQYSVGGGLGVDYYNPDSHAVPEFGLWFQTLTEHLRHRPDQQIHVEPGRALVAQCASLVARVIFVKEGERKSFVILDAGMNDLLRPALYGAYHKIENLTYKSDELRLYDVVGPVCDSTDVFAEDRTLPLTRRGDLVARRSGGAYGSVMSSTYNMRAPAYAVFSDEPFPDFK